MPGEIELTLGPIEPNIGKLGKLFWVEGMSAIKKSQMVEPRQPVLFLLVTTGIQDGWQQPQVED